MKPGNSVEDKTLTTGKRREGGPPHGGLNPTSGNPDGRNASVRPWEVMDERRE